MSAKSSQEDLAKGPHAGGHLKRGCALGCLGAVILLLVSSHFAYWILFRKFGLVCEDTTQSQAISPDGAYVATIVQTNCGATEGYDRQVRLCANNAWDRIGPGTEVAYDHGDSFTRLRWQDGRTLVVEFDPGVADPTRERQVWRDVTIAYVATALKK